MRPAAILSISAGELSPAQAVPAIEVLTCQKGSRDLCFYPVGVTLDLADATIPLCLSMADRLELMRVRVEEGL